MIIYDPKITGSFQVNGSTVTSIGEVDTISGSVAALNAATSSYALSSSISGSFTSLSASLSTRLTDDEGSIDSLNAASSSYLLNTTDTLTGDLTVTGTITAQEFHTEFVSASIIYESGSHKFGDSYDDVHEFTGSVNVTNSTGGVTGSYTFTGGNFTVSGDDADFNLNITSGSTLANLTEFRFQTDGGTMGRLYMHKGTKNMYLGPTYFPTSSLYLQDGTGTVMSITGSSVGIGTTSPNGTYGKLTVNGSISLLDDQNTKLEIGRYSAGASNSYIKLGANSNSLRITNNTDTADLIYITNDGRLGIGITPSTIWSTSYDALQIGLGGSIYAHSSAGNAMKIGSNIVYEGTAPNYYDKYLSNSTATKYEQDDGRHIWSVAGSGTAGNTVSWTEAMRITSTGNVGIGITSPGSKLTVNPSSAGSGALRLGVLNQEQYVFETGISGVTNAALILKDVSTPYTYMTFRGGYVGIGTTSPQVKLDVQTDADSTQIARFWNSNSGTSAHSVVRIASSANNANSARLEFSDANYYTATISGDRVQGLFFRTSATGADPTSIPVRMTINTTGDIGIGTTSPVGDLHLYGGQQNMVFTNTSADGVAGLTISRIIGQARGYSNNLSVMQSIDFVTNSSTWYKGDIVFRTNNTDGTDTSVAATERMRIGSGGDVLISTNGKFLQGIRNTNGSIIDMIGFGAGTDTLQIKGGTSGGANAISFYDTGGFIATFYNENLGLGTTAPKGKLDVRGCVAMGPAIYDGNLSRSATNFSQQDGGSLHINWGLGGTSSSGDTITFTYAATSWKSWSLKYNFASTNGITQGVVGGYWNNSGSNSNHVDIDNLGMSLAVTHGGTGNQNIIVTFTFTALGTHPMANFVYMQAGGDGQPRMDRVTLNAVS